jgi:hypothetical protein
MGSYQTLDAVRPRMQTGPVAMPVVDRALVGRSAAKNIRLPRFTRLAPEVVAEMIARRQRGESYGVIGRALNVSVGSIARHTKHVSPPEGGWPHSWASGLRSKPERNKEFAARLRRAGFSYDEIGREIGCSNWTVILLLDPTRVKSRGNARTSNLLRHVAIVSGYTRRDLRKIDGYSTRNARQTKARHIAFWLLRNYGEKLSYPKIGNGLGGYDHATVIHGYRKAQRVADVLSVTADMRPRAAIRALWEADWNEVGK